MTFEIPGRPGIDYPGVTCVFFCHDGQGNVLMQKRSKKCRDEWERWDIGAGQLELYEQPEEAIRREVGEEYGVEVVKIERLGFRNLLREVPPKDGVAKHDTHWIGLDFLVQVIRGPERIMEPTKILEIGWFRPNMPDDPQSGFPRPLHSAFPIFLEQHRRQLTARGLGWNGSVTDV